MIHYRLRWWLMAIVCTLALYLQIGAHSKVEVLDVPRDRVVSAAEGLMHTLDSVVQNSATHHVQLNFTIAIVAMVRNDPEGLSYFLRYHVPLFGIHNITLLDNYSDDPFMLSLLKDCERKGLRVVYKVGSFRHKGTALMKALNEFYPHVDMALPLDIDEYLIPFRNLTPIADRGLLYAELDAMYRSPESCWNVVEHFMSLGVVANMSMGNISVFAPTVMRFYGKVIVRRSELLDLDPGNHHATLRTPSLACPKLRDHLGLLHYHFRDPVIALEHAIRDGIGLGYFPADTNVSNVHLQFNPIVAAIRKAKPGYHKLAEIFGYLTKGVPGMLDNMYETYPPARPPTQWLPLDALLSAMASS